MTLDLEAVLAKHGVHMARMLGHVRQQHSWKTTLRDGACEEAERSLAQLANLTFDRCIAIGLAWSGGVKLCKAIQLMFTKGLKA